MISGILCCVVVVYSFLIFSLIYGFWKLPTIKLKSSKLLTNFSVIIPFRDEAKRLPMLLASINELQYPNTNVSFWFVDDASEDNSYQIIEKFHKEHASINIKILMIIPPVAITLKLTY